MLRCAEVTSTVESERCPSYQPNGAVEVSDALYERQSMDLKFRAAVGRAGVRHDAPLSVSAFAHRSEYKGPRNIFEKCESVY
eukprot:1845096-Pleurochrysis_carterae.AAC.1